MAITVNFTNIEVKFSVVVAKSSILSANKSYKLLV